METVMIVYTVHEKGNPPQNLEERAEGIVFIKEGFTWSGFILGPLWLLFNRLWLEFILAIVILGAVALGLVQLGLKDQAAGTVSLLAMLLVGFEGNDLKRWRLERKGYEFVASVAGRDFENCERRFFDAWLPHAAGQAARPFAAPTNLRTPPRPAGDWRGPGAIGTLPDATT
jgi:hypothetical protein